VTIVPLFVFYCQFILITYCETFKCIVATVLPQWCPIILGLWWQKQKYDFFSSTYRWQFAFFCQSTYRGWFTIIWMRISEIWPISIFTCNMYYYTIYYIIYQILLLYGHGTYGRIAVCRILKSWHFLAEFHADETIQAEFTILNIYIINKLVNYKLNVYIIQGDRFSVKHSLFRKILAFFNFFYPYFY